MCDISLGEKLVHCSNRDRTPFNTHFFFPNNNNYYYYHDHYEDRNNIGKIRSRCGATKEKDHWNSQARRREGKNKNFLGFLCEHPPRMEKDRETFRARPWVSRVESNKFSHIPGETRLSPSPFLPSVSLTKKSSTFGLRGFVRATQGTRGIKFVLE